MKILVLSFYYQPDLSAGSFRTTALVQALLEKLPNNVQIELITTLPNRYSSFSSDAPEIEDLPRLNVRRIKLPDHSGGMIDQAKAFILFVRRVLSYTKDRDYSLVYATSSRLMTAWLGALVSARNQSLLYLDIRDIFVDTIKDVLPKTINIFTKPVFSRIERWAFKRADKINLVSKGFGPYFEARYPDKNYSYFTNGIDSVFTADQVFYTHDITSASDQPKTVLYAGNIGEGQGLHNIIPALAKLMEGQLNFRIVGDGGRKLQLEKNLVAAGCKNVEVIPPVQREQLLFEYQKADVLFLHLNDYDAFRKVLPSKIFEYAAVGKPIWAGVSGYAADFIREEIPNAVVFHPCDVISAKQVFSNLDIRYTHRADFIEKYGRDSIMNNMADDIIELMKTEGLI